MLAAGSCISMVWFTIAFRRVEFNFKRLLLGSFVAAITAAPIQTWLLAQKNPLAATFKNNPFVADVIFATNLMNFILVFVLYFVSLTLTFMVFAKVTVLALPVAAIRLADAALEPTSTWVEAYQRHRGTFPPEIIN